MEILDSLFKKLLAVIVAILVLTSVTDILFDDDILTFVSSILEELPFSEDTSNIICTIWGYEKSFPIINKTSFFLSLLKLAVMSVIQPGLTMALSFFFLRVPKGNSYDQEKYMEKFGYKFKEFLITIFTAPLTAFLASYLSNFVTHWIKYNYKGASSIILSVIVFLVLALISIVPMLLMKIPLASVISVRFIGTFLLGMTKMYVMDALCLTIYISILNGAYNAIIPAAFAILVWLIIAETITKCLFLPFKSSAGDR